MIPTRLEWYTWALRIFLWSLAYVRVLLYICGSTAISWILLVLFLLLSTIAIIPHILLCQKSCGMVKYIEISRVPNLCVLFWKRSLIYDAIFDLPFLRMRTRIITTHLFFFFFFVLFVLLIQGRCEALCSLLWMMGGPLLLLFSQRSPDTS